jgi:peptide-methionine (S)-S-oxide reductase
MIHNELHFVNGKKVDEWPDSYQQAMFGLGCFWGAERLFWQLEGIVVTSVGYAAGETLDPSYQEVCGGLTGHNEVVRIVFDPQIITYQQLLEAFWQAHNPTQGMRQGNDTGSQYRSGIYTYSDEQARLAEASRDHYQQVITQSGYAEITTEIIAAPIFYFAEDYHQQYLAKNPGGYCGLGGLGLCY